MKPSELFEGENSSLRKAHDEAVDARVSSGWTVDAPEEGGWKSQLRSVFKTRVDAKNSEYTYDLVDVDGELIPFIDNLLTTHRDEIVRRLDTLPTINGLLHKDQAIATVNDVYKGKIADV